MAQLLEPSIAVTAVASHPTAAFFESEAAVDATTLLGVYSPGVDFEISLVPSTSKGNSFVYKSRATGAPFHAFLLGRVCGIEKIVADQGETTHGSVFISRLALGTTSDASEKATILFHNDVSTLQTIMNEEMADYHTITSVWCTEDVEDDDNSRIYVDYSIYSKNVNGTLAIDSIVLIDATLHRQDAYVGQKLAKGYHVVAHEVEVIGTDTLERAGLLWTRAEEHIITKMKEMELK
ncbi:hypothetical protein B0H13DRAFT_2378334 [Mycena leptocephala]|nr:hypothetical protein B0H13DRAFT_2378334 [Mycena leptocephala]